jgi:hypothetical protein
MQCAGTPSKFIRFLQDRGVIEQDEPSCGLTLCPVVPAARGIFLCAMEGCASPTTSVRRQLASVAQWAGWSFADRAAA